MMDDSQLDALIRAEAEAPNDETALAQEVLRRARRGDRPQGALAGLGIPGLAMASFAALLVAVPLAIASYLADPAAQLLGLAFGQAPALDPSLAALAGEAAR